jgi:tellurite methyltransferase
MDNRWKTYSERTKERPPRELLVKALPFVLNRVAALDLGPGALNDCRFLFDQGFQSVVAVNKDPLENDPVAQARAASFPIDRFVYVVSMFDQFNFELDRYDLINAQFALPFTSPETFDRMFGDMIASLKRDGIIAGQLFGPKDEWSANPGMTFVTRQRTDELLKDCDIVSFTEFEGLDRLAMGGTKYWHTFHFIARKKPGLPFCD